MATAQPRVSKARQSNGKQRSWKVGTSTDEGETYAPHPLGQDVIREINAHTAYLRANQDDALLYQVFTGQGDREPQPFSDPWLRGVFDKWYCHGEPLAASCDDAAALQKQLDEIREETRVTEEQTATHKRRLEELKQTCMDGLVSIGSIGAATGDEKQVLYQAERALRHVDLLRRREELT